MNTTTTSELTVEVLWSRLEPLLQARADLRRKRRNSEDGRLSRDDCDTYHELNRMYRQESRQALQDGHTPAQLFRVQRSFASQDIAKRATHG